MYRVGIIGCGSISHIHVKALENIANVEIVAFADSRQERAEICVKEYGKQKASVYESWEKMVDIVKPDVVHICTPHHCHVPIAMACLKKGIHVFMEKPPATTREQFEQLQNTIQESRARIGFCFQNRYNKSTKKVEELLEEEKVGNILGARAFVTWNRGKTYYTESEWRGKWSSEGGGVLINQSIHTLDLMVRFMGKPIYAEASMRNYHLRNVIEVEDTVEAYIQFHNLKRNQESIGLFYASNAYVEDSPVFLELQCEHALIRLEGTTVSLIYKNGIKKVFEYKGDFPGKDYWGSSHKTCIQDFYDCIENDLSFSNDFDSVKDTFLLMMKLYECGRKTLD